MFSVLLFLVGGGSILLSFVIYMLKYQSTQNGVKRGGGESKKLERQKKKNRKIRNVFMKWKNKKKMKINGQRM